MINEKIAKCMNIENFILRKIKVGSSKSKSGIYTNIKVSKYGEFKPKKHDTLKKYCIRQKVIQLTFIDIILRD